VEEDDGYEDGDEMDVLFRCGLSSILRNRSMVEIDEWDHVFLGWRLARRPVWNVDGLGL
jgi:hypothetical protein